MTLGEEGQQLYDEVKKGYEISTLNERLVLLMCDSYDRMLEEKEKGDYEKEKDLRNTFLKIWEMLNLNETENQ